MGQKERDALDELLRNSPLDLGGEVRDQRPRRVATDRRGSQHWFGSQLATWQRRFSAGGGGGGDGGSLSPVAPW